MCLVKQQEFHTEYEAIYIYIPTFFMSLVSDLIPPTYISPIEMHTVMHKREEKAMCIPKT